MLLLVFSKFAPKLAKRPTGFSILLVEWDGVEKASSLEFQLQ